MTNMLQKAVEQQFQPEGQTLETIGYTDSAVFPLLLRMNMSPERSIRAEASELEDLFLDYVESMGTSLEELVVQNDNHNTLAVLSQKRGQYQASERVLRSMLDDNGKILKHRENVSVNNVIYYNLMLAIARQGRIQESYDFRQTHLGHIKAAEALHGDLDTRLEGDRKDRKTYE